MILNCNYDTPTGALSCDLPYLNAIDAGSGQTIYVSNLWSGGEMLISFFLCVIILILISKIIFDFFFSPVVKIKRKNG